MHPAKTPPARTKPILIMSFSQNSGEPSGEIGISDEWCCIVCLNGDARTVRKRNMMVGDLSFMCRVVPLNASVVPLNTSVTWGMPLQVTGGSTELGRSLEELQNKRVYR